MVLVRLETSPEDIEGMKAAQGILTVRGGMTSHAAVVARGMGTCCVSGCSDIKMDEENKQFQLGRQDLPRGRLAELLDGSTGKIYDERHPHCGCLHRRRVRPGHGLVRQVPPASRSAPTPTPPTTPPRPVKFGAQGIGLCRTEHMFFDEDRIPAIREMICSDTVEQREKALAKLEPMQQGDFEAHL